MGLFNHQERINRGQAMKATLSQQVQEIKMIVEYFDKTVTSQSNFHLPDQSGN